MNDMANSYAAAGRHAEARKLHEETLALRKAKLGPDHPGTIESMSNLADSDYALGRLDEALKLREQTLALRRAKLGADHPDTLLSMSNLAESFLAAGRLGEALALLEEGSNAKKGDAACSRTLAALQAWLGRDRDYEATRRRALAHARGTTDGAVARRAGQAAALRPSTDPAELEAMLILGRKAAEGGKGQQEMLALGMAEFRNGHLAAADEALLAAAKAEPDAADFYRAMSLFRQGKNDEARKLATEAAAKMKPLARRRPRTRWPAAEPTTIDLILWLACKEAKSLIGLDPPKPDAK